MLVALVLLSAAATGCGSESQSSAPPPPEVTVATPDTLDVPMIWTFHGTTQAFESADIVARVQGYLSEIRFTPSTDVEKGQTLFVIEQQPFIARRDRARANEKSAEAVLRRTESDLDRLEQAVKTNAVSQQEVTRARAERDQAEAALLAARTELENAEIELAYTTVETPISGLVGRNLVDRGNLVGLGGETLLATVRRLDPIYTYFEVNERVFARLLEARHDEQDQTPKEPIPATLVVRETDRRIEGHVDAFDNAVDPSTGTIMVRGVFPNADRLVFPGFFVDVEIVGEILQGATLVVESAVGTDLGGKYLYVVGQDNVVEQRYVKLGPSQDDGTIVVLEGISPGETYVLEGLLRARPGLPVTPTAAAAEAS